MDSIQWYGYQHTNGSIQIKRFFDDRDIQEALFSDFVVRVFGPFVANSAEEAREYVKKAWVL